MAIEFCGFHGQRKLGEPTGGAPDNGANRTALLSVRSPPSVI